MPQPSDRGQPAGMLQPKDKRRIADAPRPADDRAQSASGYDSVNLQKRAGHIILIGFMGSGKTSVSRRLARFEKMSSIDMDAYLEREAGMSIAQMFETEGEEAFRARELAFLHSMFAREPSILSCGGGVVVRDESRDLLRSLGTVVFLEVDADEAVARISRPETRPLLAGSTPPAELLAARLRYYEEAADLRVNTHGRTIGQVAAAVQRALYAAGALKPQERDATAGAALSQRADVVARQRANTAASQRAGAAADARRKRRAPGTQAQQKGAEGS